MKQLTLIRHAEAGQIIGQSDSERTLSVRGQLQAESMALWLRDQPYSFDRVFCSTAQRAVQTAHLLFAEQDDYKNKVIHAPLLYDFDMDSVFHFIEGIDDEYRQIALVGHNPALSELGSFICFDFTEYLPTCAIAQFAVSVDHWIDISQGSAKLVFLQTPEACSLADKN